MSDSEWWVDEDEALALLAELVAIDSVNADMGGPGERGVAEFVENWFAAIGVETQRMPLGDGRDNIVVRSEGTTDSRILLEAHMDTVGVAGWESGSPFELRREGDRFYGRGSCDTKASLACFMLAAKNHVRRATTCRRGLVFAASVAEESDQAGAKVLANHLKSWGVSLAITGEPTCSDLISQHKGIGIYRIITEGIAAHASTPELGRSAIYEAARLCTQLEERASALAAVEVASEIYRGSLNVGVIAGGSGFNVVAGRCVMDVDRRIGFDESTSGVRGELEALCAAAGNSRIEVVLEREPLRGVGNQEWLEIALQAGKRAGLGNRVRQVPYMTNAVMYEAVGVPSIVLGPGDIAQAHKVDEYIERGQISDCLRMLEGLFC